MISRLLASPARGPDLQPAHPFVSPARRPAGPSGCQPANPPAESPRPSWRACSGPSCLFELEQRASWARRLNKCAPLRATSLPRRLPPAGCQVAGARRADRPLECHLELDRRLRAGPRVPRLASDHYFAGAPAQRRHANPSGTRGPVRKGGAPATMKADRRVSWRPDFRVAAAAGATSGHRRATDGARTSWQQFRLNKTRLRGTGKTSLNFATYSPETSRAGRPPRAAQGRHRRQLAMPARTTSPSAAERQSGPNKDLLRPRSEIIILT